MSYYVTNNVYYVTIYVYDVTNHVYYVTNNVYNVTKNAYYVTNYVYYVTMSTMQVLLMHGIAVKYDITLSLQSLVLFTPPTTSYIEATCMDHEAA